MEFENEESKESPIGMSVGETNSSQDTRFLLKRIDPENSNDWLKHNLMGEVKVGGKWCSYNKPIIRDKVLLGEIMGMIERLVNPELRLSEYTKDEIFKVSYHFGILLNDLLLLKGSNKISEPVEGLKETDPNMTCFDSEYHTQLVQTVTEYVYGNLARSIDRKEATLIGQSIKLVEQHMIQDKGNNWLKSRN